MERLMVRDWLLKRQLLWPGRVEASLWRSSSFIRFFLCEGSRAIGHHFFSIALPWLVMEITGSTADMGAVIIISGIPRVALMMVGGSLTDRLSPQRLMVVAILARAALMALLTALVFLGGITSAALYGISFAVGLTDAVLIPASGVMLPRLVPQDQLKPGNAAITTHIQFLALVSPAISGLVITWIEQSGGGLTSAGAAFAINTLGLAFSALLLATLQIDSSEGFNGMEDFDEVDALTPAEVITPVDGLNSVEATSTGGPLNPAMAFTPAQPPAPTAEKDSASLKSLLAYLWGSAGLRAAFGMVYSVNLISAAPLWVGLPILAVSRFPQGAQALGLLTSALGCGSMLGAALAGLLPQPRRMGRACLAALAGVAGGLALLNAAWALETAVASVLGVSLLVSYVNVIGLTHIQREAPEQYLGRIIGLLNMK